MPSPRVQLDTVPLYPNVVARLDIGTVTTGAPGTAAAATITDDILDLTIPRGDPGLIEGVGTLDAQNNRIINVADPTGAQDAANLRWVEAEIATALEATIQQSGGAWNAAGKRLIALADPTADTDAANKQFVVSEVAPFASVLPAIGSWAGVSAGSANSQAVTASRFTLQDGQSIDFIAGFTNTGAMALVVNSAAVPVEKDGVTGPVALAGGEIVAGNAYRAIYQASGNIFHILPTLANFPVVSLGGLRNVDPNVIRAALMNNPGRAGIFSWQTGDYSALVSTDTVSGVYVASNLIASTSGAWVRNFDGPLNVKWFGAIGDGSADDTAAAQCSINVAIGRAIYAPVGVYRTTAPLSSTIPMHIIGDGNGAGPGPAAQANSNVTQFLADFANPVVFSVNSVYPSIFRDFGINVTQAHRPAGTGVGISLSAPGTATAANSKIENVEFQNLDGIQLNRVAWPKITGCFFTGWVQDAIRSATDMAIEASAGFINNNFFFGAFDGTQRSCIFMQNGYVNITENEILGAQVGVLVKPNNYPAGYTRIFNNTIEEQYYYGVSILTQSNTQATMISVTDNEFSNVNNQSTFVASIYVDDNGGTNFLQDLQICQNVTRNIIGASAKHIWVGNGKNVIIDGNLFEEIGSNNPTLIQISGVGSNAGLLGPIQVRGNVSIGSTNKYSIAAVGVKLKDEQNLPYASLPGNVVDGSEVWCADGKATSSSNALLIGGGSGTPAWKARGSWYAHPSLT